MQQTTLVCVNVTPKHISLFLRRRNNGNENSNPIFDAIYELILPSYECILGKDNILIFHRKEATIYDMGEEIRVEKSRNVQLIDMPNLVKSNLIKLEAGKRITPFSFEIEINVNFLKNTVDNEAVLY